jgi:uncharacterized OB-fold protein
VSEDLSEAYWEGAARGVLVLQRCDDCGKVRHYPRVLCDRCYSFATSAIEAADTGEVYSWTVTHHAFAADLPFELPYTLVTVDMSAGVRVLGVLRDSGAVRRGLPVRLTFEPRPGAGPLPVFVTATGA